MTETVLDALCATLDELEKQSIQERDTIGSIYHREMPSWMSDVSREYRGEFVTPSRSAVRAVNPSPAEITINGQRITAHIVGDIVEHYGEPIYVPGHAEPVARIPSPIPWETDITVSEEEAQQIDQLLRMGNILPIEIRTQRGVTYSGEARVRSVNHRLTPDGPISIEVSITGVGELERRVQQAEGDAAQRLTQMVERRMERLFYTGTPETGGEP